MHDGIAVEIIHGGHEAFLEFLLGCDADVAQDGAGEFGKEALDEVEPLTAICTPVKLSRGGCSFQFGRASAPMIPHLVHTMRGPKDGTVISPRRWSTFITT